MMHIYYDYIIYSSFIMTPDVSMPLSMPISLSSFCPCFFKSQGWYHTNKKLCKNLLKKCVRSIMMCRYSPCLVHWYWKIVQTGCPPTRHTHLFCRSRVSAGEGVDGVQGLDSVQEVRNWDWRGQGWALNLWICLSFFSIHPKNICHFWWYGSSLL